MATQAYSGTTELAVIIPEIWVTESLGYLQANTVTASLVRRDFEANISKFGDIVNLSSRATLTKKSKSAATQIDIENPTNTALQVQLSSHDYVAFGVEDIAEAQANQDVMVGYVDDGGAVIAEGIDAALLALYADASSSTGTAGTDLAVATVVNARKTLNDSKIPQRNRAMVISSKDEAALLKLEAVTSAEKIGDDGTALREASLGRLYGFSMFMDQQVRTSGSSPTTTHNMAFHRDAMTLAVRPLPLPPAGMGAVGSVYNKDGISMRFTAAWSIKDMATIVVLDVLYGVKTLRAAGIVDTYG